MQNLKKIGVCLCKLAICIFVNFSVQGNSFAENKITEEIRYTELINRSVLFYFGIGANFSGEMLHANSGIDSGSVNAGFGGDISFGIETYNGRFYMAAEVFTVLDWFSTNSLATQNPSNTDLFFPSVGLNMKFGFIANLKMFIRTYLMIGFESLFYTEGGSYKISEKDVLTMQHTNGFLAIDPGFGVAIPINKMVDVIMEFRFIISIFHFNNISQSSSANHVTINSFAGQPTLMRGNIGFLIKF